MIPPSLQYELRHRCAESIEVGSANSTWFNSYHPYADHIQFLNDLEYSYPSNSEIVTIGDSLQGRPITGIHFYGTGLKNTNPAVVFHGTVHAREWITTMVHLCSPSVRADLTLRKGHRILCIQLPQRFRVEYRYSKSIEQIRLLHLPSCKSRWYIAGAFTAYP